MTRNLHFSTTGAAGARTDHGFTAIEVLIVALVMTVVAAMAIPFTSNTLALFRVGGDSRALVNGVGMTKMRAASDFSRAFLRRHRGAIVPSGGLAEDRAAAVGAGRRHDVAVAKRQLQLGNAATPPPDAVAPIAQALPLDNAGNAWRTPRASFSPRGIPVDLWVLGRGHYYRRHPVLVWPSPRPARSGSGERVRASSQFGHSNERHTTTTSVRSRDRRRGHDAHRDAGCARAAARAHGWLDVGRGRHAEDHGEPGQPRRADDGVRAGQDGAAARPDACDDTIADTRVFPAAGASGRAWPSAAATRARPLPGTSTTST